MTLRKITTFWCFLLKFRRLWFTVLGPGYIIDRNMILNIIFMLKAH